MQGTGVFRQLFCNSAIGGYIENGLSRIVEGSPSLAEREGDIMRYAALHAEKNL